MKEIRTLLQEYKNRFLVTDKIKVEDYPFQFEHRNLNKGVFVPRIEETEIWNENGKVYENGVWATADVKSFPEKWIVKKDENNPLWEKFKNWYEIKTEFNEYYWGDIYYGLNNNYTKISDNLKFLKKYQYLTLEQWVEFCLSKVDFSILNDEDWFYVESDSKWIAKGNIISYNNSVKGIHFNINDSKLYNLECYLMGKEVVKVLRKATEDDLKLLFEKHPELAPPQVGDYGLYFDNLADEIDKLKNKQISIGVLEASNSKHMFPFDIVGENNYTFFYKLDMNRLIPPQIDEFIKLHDK